MGHPPGEAKTNSSEKYWSVMKIGVSGASRHLGRAVVSELLQRPSGHEVVAITRTPKIVSGPAQGRFGTAGLLKEKFVLP